MKNFDQRFYINNRTHIYIFLRNRNDLSLLFFLPSMIGKKIRYIFQKLLKLASLITMPIFKFMTRKNIDILIKDDHGLAHKITR